MTIIDDILACIDPTGADAQLPDGAAREFAAVLAKRTDDRQLFVALAYCSVQLADAGLERAARQLLELARIGLRDQALERALSDTHAQDSRHRASGLKWRRSQFKAD